jgi:hemin uptake protein HemP
VQREERTASVQQSVRAEKRPAVIEVATLFGAAQEIRLLHRGEEYRLRITKSGKLILTK